MYLYTQQVELSLPIIDHFGVSELNAKKYISLQRRPEYRISRYLSKLRESLENVREIKHLS